MWQRELCEELGRVEHVVKKLDKGRGEKKLLAGKTSVSESMPLHCIVCIWPTSISNSVVLLCNGWRDGGDEGQSHSWSGPRLEVSTHDAPSLVLSQCRMCRGWLVFDGSNRERVPKDTSSVYVKCME